MSDREAPNLEELDRVERETEPDAFVPQEEMEFLWGQLRPLLDLVDGLGQRLEEAQNRKVLLNGMTQEQKAAIFDIKAILSDGLAHYQRAKGGSP